MITQHAAVSCLSFTLFVAGGTHADVLYDNGDTDGTNGFSNGIRAVIGFQRTVLDDFIVPEGETWIVTGLRHRHIWNTEAPPAGFGMEIALRHHGDGMPGDVFAFLEIVGYDEAETGRVMFDRPEAESFTSFTAIELGPGHYWFDATVVGPENNFWLLREAISNDECWVNYEDACGISGCPLLPGGADLAWALEGQVVSCPGDLDENGTIDLADLLAILGAWGECPGCPEDLDSDGSVGLADLLILLAGWGPC